MDIQVLQAQNESLLAENKAIKEDNAKLSYELAELKRMVFGARRERQTSNNPLPGQGSLFENSLTQDTTAAKEPSSTEQDRPEKECRSSPTKKQKAAQPRNTFPAHLPRHIRHLEPDIDTEGLEVIGVEISQTLDYIPGQLKVIETRRKKYKVDKNTPPLKKRDGSPAALDPSTLEEGQTAILIAKVAERPIPKGIAEAGLLAQLFVAKYIDHLPFYRQIQGFKRDYDYSVAQSTINDWFAACCTLLEPLYEKLIQQVLHTDYIQVDESPIKVLDKKLKNKSHRGYMWVYRNPISGLVLFDYRQGRGMHGPKERLRGFEGVLQCDGYEVYKKLAKTAKATIHLVSCLAHIRRKFFKAKEHHPEVANHALEQIRKIYAFERQYKEQGLDLVQKLKARQEQVQPILEQLISWVEKEQLNNLSKGPIGKALYYAKNELPQLRQCIKDARVEIDNNLIENTIRPLALGRKNYLFAGSHKAAQRAAMMYAFFASCKTLSVNPRNWLCDILKRIGTHPINRIEELLPDQWGKSN